MTDSSVEAVESIKAALYSNLRIEPVPNRMYDWRIEAESIDEAAEATLAAIAALPSPEQEPMREALEGYRAAVSFISADSWDGCHDCIDILRAARSVDVEWDWAGNPDRIAAELKSLRRRAGMNGAPPDAALAPPPAQSGDRT